VTDSQHTILIVVTSMSSHYPKPICIGIGTWRPYWHQQPTSAE